MPLPPIPIPPLTPKFGKLPARNDPRDFLFSRHLKAGLLPTTAPESYDVNAAHPDTKIFPILGRNDRIGDCVLVMFLNMLRQMEYREQGIVLDIPDDLIEQIYFDLTGGEDKGLVIGDFLNKMRNDGITIAGKTYKISAYCRVNIHDPNEVRLAASGHMGLLVGAALPDNAVTACLASEAWMDTSLPPNPENGHGMYVSKYARDYTHETWARYQTASEAWRAKYWDEAFYVVDARDPWIDMKAVKTSLEALG